MCVCVCVCVHERESTGTRCFLRDQTQVSGVGITEMTVDELEIRLGKARKSLVRLLSACVCVRVCVSRPYLCLPYLT